MNTKETKTSSGETTIAIGSLFRNRTSHFNIRNSLALTLYKHKAVSRHFISFFFSLFLSITKNKKKMEKSSKAEYVAVPASDVEQEVGLPPYQEQEAITADKTKSNLDILSCCHGN